MDIFDTKVSGIPARVRVTHARYHRPDSRADSTDDYYGGWAIQYELLDRRGRPAAWLEMKASEQDRARIETEIIRHMA